VYIVEPVGGDVPALVNTLPTELLDDFAELRAALDVSPWTAARGDADEP
jgi:hypothetical protein